MATKDTSNQIEFILEGVDSEHCAHIVDKGLESVEGVSSHHVELNNHKAVIEYEGSSTVSNAVKAIENLGYGVTKIKKNIPVLEMNCASCAGSTESMLKATKGVLDASVNFASTSAQVSYLPNVVTLTDLQAAVRSIGFDLLVEDEETQQDTLQIIQEERYSRLKKKTIWALVLAAPVFIIGMFFMHMPYGNEIMFLFTTPVLFWLGRDFFINAWKQAKHRSANMDTLVALSTGVAYIFSVFTMLYPSFWTDRNLEAHVYFEAAAVIIAFILLGKLLEERAKGNTSKAIKNLMGLQPKTVTVIDENGSPKELSITDVQIGYTILVKPGEKIAVDGSVIEGNSYVDESMLSGEAIPVLKKEQDTVFAGTINQTGSFRFKAEKVGKHTVLSQIIKMVQDAQGSKPPVQKLVDKIAGIFVPIVIGIGLLSCLLWIILGGSNSLTQGILAFVTVLVIACPCALGLATPTAIMVGVGKGAENGILIKDAESLELAKDIDIIILDKTGTITEGAPKVTNEYWAEENRLDKSILISIEAQSEHPLAKAIVNHYNDHSNGVNLKDFQSHTGSGVSAHYDNNTYYVGNTKLMRDNHINIPEDIQATADQLTNTAKTVIWFAKNEQIIAIIAIADQVKKTSKQAIQSLHELGIDTHMLTGDNEATARSIAAEVGITSFKAEVLPEQKAEYILSLQKRGKKVAMVGDGINDSAALAHADVSIAMGKGSDIAMDVAKMTIISSDLNKISTAIKLSKHTTSTIRQNLFWAFIYNIIGIPIAAGLLYPINGFLLSPMIASAAMALSSVSVVSNSLRLKWKKI